MKTTKQYTVITTLTDKNFKVTKNGKKKVSVPLLDGVWVDAWFNPNLDAKVNFKVGDTVIITANQINTEDNEYNGEVRKQHTFHFPNILPIDQPQQSGIDTVTGTQEGDPFGGSPMEISNDDLPF